MSLFTPALRAIAQLGDRVFLGVVLRSVGWATLAFVALAAGLGWGAHRILSGHDAGGWLSVLLGGTGSALLALLLFLPLAAGIGTLFIDRVAATVERRWYPALPPAHAAPLGQQIADGIALGLRVLGLQIVALVLALLLPGVGLILGWVVAAWAIGRGFFVTVAMRRLDRQAALALYRQRRLAVLAQGGLATAASLVPLLNLLVPVLCPAALVHVMHADVAVPDERVVGPARHVLGQPPSPSHD